MTDEPWTLEQKAEFRGAPLEWMHGYLAAVSILQTYIGRRSYLYRSRKAKRAIQDIESMLEYMERGRP